MKYSFTDPPGSLSQFPVPPRITKMQVFLIKKQVIILAVLQAFELSFSMLEIDSVHVHKFFSISPLFFFISNIMLLKFMYRYI